MPLNRLPPPSPRRRGEGICRARSLPRAGGECGVQLAPLVPSPPPAGRRCRQADEGRVTANANVSAYGFDPKDPSASLATAGNTDAATPE
ncbi:hypothetical protein EBB04_16665 [Sinorhizobium meliloti]|nr:hypothetical protein EBB04_16665 [Sinorhizobium meliloti]